MHKAAALLFELGSEGRLRILSSLNDQSMKLSQLAKRHSSTIQEVSRQCKRLEEGGLIERRQDGKFALTPVGNVTLSLLPSFSLLRDESEYFSTHDMSSLPIAFVERMGELVEHRRLDHIDDVLQFQHDVVKESERFVWFMSDQPVGHSLRADHSHFSHDTTLRVILPSRVDMAAFKSAKIAMGSRFEVGLLGNVNLVIAMNEKTAAFGLPTLDGRPDYSRGFVGDTQGFLGWCQDLFSYYWEKSVKRYA